MIHKRTMGDLLKKLDVNTELEPEVAVTVVTTTLVMVGDVAPPMVIVPASTFPVAAASPTAPGRV